jgi:hypothetical protein
VIIGEKLRAWQEVGMSRSLSLVMIFMCSTAVAVTHYVDLNSSSPTPPYTSWATAATNIQAAVDASSSNDTVLVTNGTYLLSSEIVVDKGILIQSVNGPNVTVIDGTGSIDGPGAGRCMNLGSNSCVVSGFTIQNGIAAYWSVIPLGGGGIYCADTTPVITNCIVRSNTAYSSDGGGVWGGTIVDSIR